MFHICVIKMPIPQSRSLKKKKNCFRTSRRISLFLRQLSYSNIWSVRLGVYRRQGMEWEYFHLEVTTSGPAWGRWWCPHISGRGPELGFRGLCKTRWATPSPWDKAVIIWWRFNGTLWNESRGGLHGYSLCFHCVLTTGWVIECLSMSDRLCCRKLITSISMLKSPETP